MNQVTLNDDADIDGNTLLAAYQLLIETTLESGSDETLLQRALAVISAIRWPTRHRFFSALLPGDTAGLRLAAFTGGVDRPPPPCDDATAVGCLCGRALTHPRRLLFIEVASEAERPPCDPGGVGMHLILPLAARGRVLGVLHALVEPGQEPDGLEKSFLVQVATLLGSELHRRRGEREHDRLETQFLQAQKMEAVGRLAGGVAHDFNNILTAITNYADLGLLKLDPQNPLYRNFEKIIEASDRAALLTQQLLAFSRRQVVAPRIVDINAIVTDLRKMLSRLLGADLELSLTSDPGLERILADPALIEQLIINLIVNARDAMPRGGAIAIETANTQLDSAYTLKHPGAPPGRYVCLAVSARGEGVRAAALCDPGEAPQKPATGGTLGPAAIFDIIRQCGGNVQCETDQDCSAALRIHFPVVSADAARVVATAGKSHMPQGGETILLTEDDDSVRVIMAEVLRDLGYQVLEAREGREALSLAIDSTRHIDVLVTDVVLPGGGGNELYLRLTQTLPALRVLYLSDIGDEAVARQVLPDPSAVHLQKPFSPWALASLLREVLDTPPPAPAPA